MKFLNIKLLIILVIGSIVTIAQSLDITELEYYFNTDPGFGNGTSVPVSPDSITNTSFNLDISGLSAGIHYAFIRAKDENGVWSNVYKMIVNKVETLPVTMADDITDLEYFFDIDPGFGLGTQIPVVDDIITNTTFDIDISGLSPGYHKVYFRSKDENDRWTLNYVQNLVKVVEDPIAPSTNVIAMEYFFDTDPGFGNGISIPLISDTITNTVFDIDVSGLDAGYHKVYIRTKNESEVWNLSYIHNIVKVIEEPFEALPELLTLEYYFDNDPGFGNGKSVSISPDSIVDLNFSIDISAEYPGDHNLYIRLKDENNIWSHSANDSIFVKGLRVLLEGPFNPGTKLMSTTLYEQDLIPLEQPFNSDPTAVWYYDGSESVAEIPNENIVDWLLLQVRDATSAVNATPATIKENQVAFLLNNGKIVGLDGNSNISFSEPIDDNLYLVVFQRNHLGVMSSGPVDITGDYPFTYLFSDGSDQVYGDANGHKEISPGLWGMMGGDGDGNGQIEMNDKTIIWQSQAGKTNYFSGDYNLDGQVDNSDKNDTWIENNNTSSQIPN